MTDCDELGLEAAAAKEIVPMTRADRRLILVIGPGRSGTSSMAGTLAASGFVVPDPVEPEESNPAGFFEPSWVTEFHQRLLDRADVRSLDSDPDAAAEVAPYLADDAARQELRTWLAARLDEHDRVVVKDPRLVWFHELWVSVAADLRVDPGFVVMLRHPSEVSSSRSEFYHSRELTAVAGWVNVALLTERLTRGAARAFVLYPAVTVDWRTQLTRVQDLLGLHLEPGPEQGCHPADDFIDPALRRRTPGWEHSPVPERLRDLADATFDALSSVIDSDGDERLVKELSDLQAEYRTLHQDSMDMVRHHVMRERRRARRRGGRRLNEVSSSPTLDPPRRAP
jgi:hypothetical protein